MQSRFLLNIVIGKSPAILKLFAGKDEALLVRRNAFLILNLRLDVVNGIAGFDLKSDGLASH